VKLFSLGPSERIKSRTVLNNLFLHGKSLTVNEFYLIYCLSEFNPVFPVKAAFIVPSKKIRKAVKRNEIRRQIRESYRKNKQELYDFAKQMQTGINIAIMFRGSAEIEKDKTEEKIIVLLQRLISNIKAGK